MASAFTHCPTCGVPWSQHLTMCALSQVIHARDLGKPKPPKGDGQPTPGHKFFGPFLVKVEHPAGSTRTGTGPDGSGWATKMHNDYGELPGSVGADGDPVDVYLGPNPDAKIVHVVHMNDQHGNYDEDKAFLGFDSQPDVIKAFKKHYPDGSARIGAITSHRVKGFRAKVRLNKLAGRRGDKPVKLHASGMPGPDAEGTRADVAALMEYRSFNELSSSGNTVAYQRDKHDRVVTVRFGADGRIKDATLTYADGQHEGKPVTKQGWEGVFALAQTHGD